LLKQEIAFFRLFSGVFNKAELKKVVADGYQSRRGRGL
jgi:hypothetical protein